MRLPLIAAALLSTLLYCASGYATPSEKPVSSRNLGLSIRVEGGGWGAAGKQQIETVLYAVADELLLRVPKKLTAPIVVTHTQSNPIALYDRGPAGEYLVHLHATDTRWQLYAFEFAHELCHLMSNFDENVSADTIKRNQWFEESLCETASLYTLRKLSADWESSPPSPEFSPYAGKLRSFADLLIHEEHRRLPPHTSLAAWVQDGEQRLRADPYQRDKNELLANRLLPLFERDPYNWDALCYLNLDPADTRDPLRQYLDNWYRNAPAEHKAFIADVLDLLGFGSEAPAGGATIAAQAPAPADVPKPPAALAAQAGPIQH
jgi:hypothetical protein